MTDNQTKPEMADNEQTEKPQKRAPFKSVKTRSYIVKTDASNFESMTHQELVVEAKRLQNHVTQLRNILNKKNGDNSGKFKNKNHSRKDLLILINIIRDMFY